MYVHQSRQRCPMDWTSRTRKAWGMLLHSWCSHRCSCGRLPGGGRFSRTRLDCLAVHGGHTRSLMDFVIFVFLGGTLLWSLLLSDCWIKCIPKMDVIWLSSRLLQTIFKLVLNFLWNLYNMTLKHVSDYKSLLWLKQCQSSQLNLLELATVP